MLCFEYIDCALFVHAMGTMHAFTLIMKLLWCALFASKNEQVECCFIFALIWSVGASTDGASRAAFSDFLQRELNRTFSDEHDDGRDEHDRDSPQQQRQQQEGQQKGQEEDPVGTLTMPFPAENTVYDYQVTSVSHAS